jgi:hypothetical protein
MADRKRTIMIPDFLKVIRKKYSTQANALGILNAITEEGWMGKLQSGQTIDRKILANVITALVYHEILDKRRRWLQLGFLSRFVPLSFSYSAETKDKIRDYIRGRDYKNDSPNDENIGIKPESVALTDEMAQKLQNITMSALLRFKEQNLTGFRLQRQLQVLAMASALTRGKQEVEEVDIELIREISYFINFDFNKI